jgi:NhaP-type Na+/H+ or K+/H+ antiporter
MPDSVIFWYLVAGGVLVAMALAGSLVRRLPLSTSTLYLGLGVILGPIVLSKIRVDAVRDAGIVHRLAELGVIVSLFTAGLKLRVSWRDGRWAAPLRLASVSMVVTAGLIACAGAWLIGLPWGAAVLLGAVLAPTDPVLASDVQLEDPFDRDEVRFALTGEAGLNDGTAFPIALLGLGMLGLHPLGAGLWRWWAIDVAWGLAAGLVIGGTLGVAVGRVVVYLRRKHREALGRDEFLALGLIALSYGLAVWARGYGFLSVFAAGWALRQMELVHTRDAPDVDSKDVAKAVEATPSPDVADPEELATDPVKGPAYLAGAVLFFNEQLERFLEVALVLLVGGMISARYLTWDVMWLSPLLFVVIRPIAVWVGLIGLRLDVGRPVQRGRKVRRFQRGLIAWFGIRGIGSIYYLMFAIERGVDGDLARRLAALVLGVVAVSVVVHGVSVTPLMKFYERLRKRPRRGTQSEGAATGVGHDSA